MMTNVTQTARYHFAVKQTRDGGFSVVFEAIEGDVFETAGIWMGMRSQRAADELASILNRSVMIVGRTLSTADGVGGWSN